MTVTRASGMGGESTRVRPAPTRATRAGRGQPHTAPVTSYTAGVDEHGRRVWTLTFPAPARMISVNGNPHWRATAPARKTWREAMFMHAKAAKLPTGLRRVRVDIELRFPTGGRRDAGNYHPHVAKPIVDAIGPPMNMVRGGQRVTAVGYRLIPDDTAEYLDGPFLRLGPAGRRAGCPLGQVVVTITDVGGTP